MVDCLVRALCVSLGASRLEDIDLSSNLIGEGGFSSQATAEGEYSSGVEGTAALELAKLKRGGLACRAGRAGGQGFCCGRR